MPTHYGGTTREVRALDAFIKLSRAGDRLATHLNRGLSAAGLTPAQFAILEALLHLGPMNQRELGRKLLRSNPHITSVLDNLERDGLIDRERSSEDRRVVHVSLTREGRRLIERMFPGHARHIADLLDALTSEEQEELGRLCKKLGLALMDRPAESRTRPEPFGQTRTQQEGE